MLRISSVSKAFAKPLLIDASMDIPAGTGALLCGPNGAGKSTLLKIIAGVLAPDSGQVFLDGLPAYEQRMRLAFCPSTSAGFYRRLTARQNLHYFGSLYSLSRKTVDRYIAEADIFKIDYWNLPTERLSDGMLQKIKLVRAFMHQPAFAILDEPFNYLDRESKDLFLGWLRGWCARKSGRSYILTQHSLELPEKNWAIRQFRLEAVVQ
ncbi:MAG: ABC transporter ATP-binding protein [Deltaproteobacteria bacterium]|nr:ABC transporter ATP-binding protein [Deltaproteobacteria bacterium]